MRNGLQTEWVLGARSSLRGSEPTLIFRTLSRRRGLAFGPCRASADDGNAAAATALVSYLRQVLRFFGTHTKGDGGDPTTVVKFRSAAHTAYYLVAHAQQQNSTLFEAELLRMEPALAHLGDEN